MRRALVVALFAAEFVLFVPGKVLGQADEEPATIEAELADLNATLKEIAQLLRRQGIAQDLDLLMKRVQLAEGSMLETEKGLTSAQSELRSLQEERTHTELRLQTLPDEIERAGSAMPASQAEAMTSQLESALRGIRNRAGELANQIAELESRLADQRDQVRGWLTTLDRRLAAH